MGNIFNRNSKQDEPEKSKAYNLTNLVFNGNLDILEEAKKHKNNNNEVKVIVEQVEELKNKAAEESAKAVKELKEQEEILERLNQAANKYKIIGDRAAYERNRARIEETRENIKFIKNKIDHIILSVLPKDQYGEIINNLLDVFENSQRENAKKALELINELKEVCLDCVADKQQADELLSLLTNTLMNVEYREVLNNIDVKREKSQTDISTKGISTRSTPLFRLAGIDKDRALSETVREIKRLAGN